MPSGPRRRRRVPVLYALFVGVLGRAWGEPFFASFLVGYLAYDYMHLAVHRCRPRTRVGAFLRRWHMRHHFVSPEAGWGVSSPLWDHVFRTAARRLTASDVRMSRAAFRSWAHGWSPPSWLPSCMGRPRRGGGLAGRVRA